jgi:methylated-DNA-protein-cysteine methyltransferase-like protein
MGETFYESVIEIIKSIPHGKVATYGEIADYAGNKRTARQVSYILNSSWEKHKLPWHRVVNSKGGISLRKGHGYELQKKLLKREGIKFDKDDKIDLKKFQWFPEY